jgi:hypothetical protein
MRLFSPLAGPPYHTIGGKYTPSSTLKILAYTIVDITLACLSGHSLLPG